MYRVCSKRVQILFIKETEEQINRIIERQVYLNCISEKQLVREIKRFYAKVFRLFYFNGFVCHSVSCKILVCHFSSSFFLD